MDRRKFMGLAAGGSAAATLSKAGPMLGGPVSGCPKPLPPDPSTVSSGKLIIPTDTPDRFHAKIMEFNPVPALNAATWELEVGGLVRRPLKLKLADLKRLPQVKQSSRMKCVQCWSTRIEWEGFRSKELFQLAHPLPSATHVRFDCGDKYYDYDSLEEMLHPHVLLALRMNGEPLTPEHGAPLRLVIPWKYGYKYVKLITRITFLNHGGKVWWPIRGPIIRREAIFSPASIILLIFQARFAGSRAEKSRITNRRRVMVRARGSDSEHMEGEFPIRSSGCPCCGSFDINLRPEHASGALPPLRHVISPLRRREFLKAA